MELVEIIYFRNCKAQHHIRWYLSKLDKTFNFSTHSAECHSFINGYFSDEKLYFTDKCLLHVTTPLCSEQVPPPHDCLELDPSTFVFCDCDCDEDVPPRHSCPDCHVP